MEQITEEEKKEFRGFLEVIYGSQVNRWNINVEVLKLFEVLIRKSETCSQSMDLVPRPFVAGNAIKWASKQARKAVLRILKRKEKQYFVCLRAAGLGMKREFELASLGI